MDLINSTMSTAYTTSNNTMSNVTYPPDFTTRKIYMIIKTVVPIIMSIIMLVGVVGNSTLIYIVISVKSMRNVPNILIVSLAVADLLLLLMSTPFAIIVYVFKTYPFNDVICKGNEYLQTLSLAVSVFTLTALSGDRYVAIVHPMSKHKGKPTFKIIVTVTAIWILAAILAIPDAVSFKVTESFCTPYPEEWGEWYPKAHVMFRFIVLFALPLLITGIFYCLMARILVKSSKQIPCESTISSATNQQQQRQIEARIKVAKVVLSFVVLFVVCWLPRHVFLLWYYFSPALFSTFWMIFKTIAYCFTYIYACVNPYALYVLSSQFRKYYNRYIFRCCPKSYRRIPPESNPSLIYNSTMRRGSTSITVVKASSEL